MLPGNYYVNFYTVTEDRSQPDFYSMSILINGEPVYPLIYRAPGDVYIDQAIVSVNKTSTLQIVYSNKNNSPMILFDKAISIIYLPFNT